MKGRLTRTTRGELVVGFRGSGFDFKTTYAAGDDRLRGFFVPALQRAVRYDRTTGYFTSGALVSVARGLAEFLRNDGRMRLLAGVDLADEDVAALERGSALDEVLAERLLADPLVGETIIQERRLEVLAWLVREGRLEIRIGVPLSADGRPLPRGVTGRYFHEKSGVLVDASGDRLAFVGSNNESSSGLDPSGNLEMFAVYPSWWPEPWAHYGQPVVDGFEQKWGDKLEGWRIVPLPEAINEALIKRVKGRRAPPAERDPELDPELPAAPFLGVARERLQDLLEAPTREGGTGVGFVTAPVLPWPHQLRIAERIVSTFPRSYLLADEVGMGKTIEAGLVFRELLLSGKAERILALVPASVIKQWQEELEEKFLLRVPRLDGGAYFYRTGGVDEPATPPNGGNPWDAFPVLLASSHLARRKSRRSELLAAGPWDVVFVDEAHHARRRGSKEDDPPNALLALLRAMKDAGSWRALYLASATPMQMYAHEAWDLLELLGLTQAWGANAGVFTRYYEQLREAPAERDWAFLKTMLADHFTDSANAAPPNVVEQVKAHVPAGLRARRILSFHESNVTASVLAERPANELEALTTWLRENTPMRRRVFRTTRTTLREYKREGLLAADTTIPSRHVIDRFIPMTSEEAALYRQIERYISRYYDRYRADKQAHRALGFIMTIYRRRLTSSFLAIERSMRKRRDALAQQDAHLSRLLDPDDVDALDAGDVLDADYLEQAQFQLDREVDELDDYLAELAKRPPDESKMLALHEDLQDAFAAGHKTVIIFTQYTDTLDYIAERLTGTYGGAVATWSGAGGRRWDAARHSWIDVPKPGLKDLFREGEQVKILIGTDSMSEGLNLQTCGFLVNYDMPWNFMRVEQRIGRVDRIGGQPRIEVRNYFYRDTVEQQIYEGLAHDIDWFQNVVGPARPVLGQIESIIEEVAMVGSVEERTEGVRTAIQHIQADLRVAEAQPLHIDDFTGTPEEEVLDPEVSLDDIERELLTNPLANRHLSPTMEVGVYRLSYQATDALVTFDRQTAEDEGPRVELLTYGSPRFEPFLKWLVAAPNVD